MTKLGEVLDPVADRVGIIAVLVTMAVLEIVPWWVPAIAAAVDVTVAAGAGRLAAAGRIRVSRIGKIRTAALFTGITGLTAASTLGSTPPLLGAASTALVGVGVLLHAVAAWGYLRQAHRARADRRER